MTISILALAHERAKAALLPYEGALTPAEAYALLENGQNVRLVDVRTNAERDWVGRVAIPDSQHLALEWNLYPAGHANPDFMNQLSQMAEKDTVLLFLCRAGVRSHHAAALATEYGFKRCFNILEGFEGTKNADGHRKNVDGWCKAGLPWVGA